MPQQSARISKSRRRELFKLLLPSLLPPCRCCFPFLAECQCDSEWCQCEIDIEIRDRHGDDCECDWPESETRAFHDELARALAILDPINYADPPKPTMPIVTMSQDMRIEFMRNRFLTGQHLYHPDDRSGANEREGETIVVRANGVKKRGGVGHVENPRHEARFSTVRERRMHCPVS